MTEQLQPGDFTERKSKYEGHWACQSKDYEGAESKWCDLIVLFLTADLFWILTGFSKGDFNPPDPDLNLRKNRNNI